MLTAAVNKKLKRKIELHEDEITSCVFGAMQSLSVELVWDLFTSLVRDAHIGNSLPDCMPDKVELEFWPRWKTATGSVEPDLVFHFYQKRGTIDIPIIHGIMEIKWEAGLSPPCELIRQWNHRCPKDSAPWIHIYLVKHYSKGKKELAISLKGDDLCNCQRPCTNGLVYRGGQTPNEWAIGCVGWQHLVKAVRNITTQAPSWWSEGVPSFFAKYGVVSFVGFSCLFEGEVRQDDLIFFKRKPFWNFLENIGIGSNSGNIFFNKSM